MWIKLSVNLVAAWENLLQKPARKKPARQDPYLDRKNRVAEKPLDFTAEKF